MRKNLIVRNPFKTAMSNPKGLLGQKLCHYLNQGRTLNNIYQWGRKLNGLLWSSETKFS